MKSSSLIALVILCAHLLLPSSAFAQIVVLDIAQRPTAAGIFEYDVTGFAAALVNVTPVSLTAPDGTRFTKGLSFEEVESRFFGEWTVGGSDNPETFTLSTFGLNDVFSEVPTFVSPTGSGNSATVTGSSFLLDWECPSGRTDFSGFNISTSTFGPLSVELVSEPFDSTSVNAIVSPTPFLTPGPTDFVFTVGNSSSIEDFISLGEDSDLLFQTDFTTFSQEFSVTVVPVPEPGTGVIFSAAILLLVGLRRRT